MCAHPLPYATFRGIPLRHLHFLQSQELEGLEQFKWYVAQFLKLDCPAAVAMAVLEQSRRDFCEHLALGSPVSLNLYFLLLQVLEQVCVVLGQVDGAGSEGLRAMAAVLLRTLFDIRSDVWFRAQQQTQAGGNEGDLQQFSRAKIKPLD